MNGESSIDSNVSARALGTVRLDGPAIGLVAAIDPIATKGVSTGGSSSGT